MGISSVIIAAMLWGTTGTVQALLPESREPLAVGAMRLLVGAIALLAMALAHQPSRRALVRLPWVSVFFAGSSIACYNLLFFWAVSEAGVGIGTAVTIGSAPFWATAYEALSRTALPTRKRLGGQIISIIGVAFLGLAAADDGKGSLGLVLALGAGASYASYSLITSKIGHKAPSTAIAAGTFSCAALLTLPVLAVVPIAWVIAPGVWLAIGFLGIVATGLAYAFYTWGLTRVAASSAVTLALAEPVTAWLLATVIIKDPVTLTSATGVGLILVGLIIVARHPSRKLRAELNKDL
ncbi:DMT family transporter [Cognatishimia sp. WU-CL00825]